MFSLVRKVVAGPKRTTTYEGYELDLTYITERVIAMAFPASDLFEKTYRNSIEDVVKYFQDNHHNNFMIFNVSSRKYDYQLFDNRVIDYQWPDHQAPPLTTLLQIGYDMFCFLKESNQRVVAVHCNHGKGRTGSAIIAFMLLIGHFQSARDCLKYYNSKRFNKITYGVDQPCQVRYLNFVEHLINSTKIHPKLICYRIKKITNRGLDDNYFVRIHRTRTQEVVYDRVGVNQNLEDNASRRLMQGDIFIQIFSTNWTGDKRIARINYNLHFVNSHLELTFKGQHIKLSDSHTEDFSVTLHLEYNCLCHLPTYSQTKCNCQNQRTEEEKYWQTMITQINECKELPTQEIYNLLFGSKSSNQQKGLCNGKEEPSSIVSPAKKIAKSFSGQLRTSHQQKLYALVQYTKQQRISYQDNEETGPVQKQANLGKEKNSFGEQKPNLQ